MALLGKIQDFEPENESMSAYLERCYNPSGQNTRDAARLGRTTTDNCIKDLINRACVYTYIINIDQSLKATYNWPMQ